MAQTPSGMGYRMPAEWEPHEGTWLAWPKNPETFTEEHIAPVRKAYAAIIAELCEGERVHLLVDDRASQKQVLLSVDPHPNLAFHMIRSADVWIRDYGPIFVRGSGMAATKWVFNAWGNKYSDLLPDNETGLEVVRETGMPFFEIKHVLEGGSIDPNGAGLLLTTKQCLLDKNRNPSLDSGGIEALLRDNLGVENVIWLEGGIAGDDTDGHVDDVARFVARDTVLCMTEQGSGENSDSLAANLEALRRAKTADGQALRLETLPMPAPIEGETGVLPASYANFYIGNSVVLVPTYGDPNDGRALKTLGRLFPTRRTVGVDCRSLVTGLGAMHCVTQQQPAGLEPTRRPQSSL